MLMPVTCYFGMVVLLLTCTFSSPAMRPAGAASNALYNLSDLTQHPNESIFSPLLRALSDHGGARWSPGWRQKIKPEYKYIKYLTEVFKRPSRVQRSVDEKNVLNAVRLIKPQDDCLVARNNKESFIQDLSYNLDQVKKTEQLLKSTLLYSFDPDRAWSVSSGCYLSITEQEPSNHCWLCPQRSVHHSVNFTGGKSWRNWVEIDVTMFLLPFRKFQKNNLHLLINVTCPEDQVATNSDTLELMLRSPSLLLYLSETSAVARQRFLVNNAAQKISTAEDKVHEEMSKIKHGTGHKKRWKRSSQKSKRDKSLKTQLPELLPSSEFTTSDCALYDFRVQFSQLKLDHWIVFPPKYNPRYCKGICPSTLGFFYGSPVHTMVQNIIHEKLDSSVPRPSCVPSHYSPLSVMIFEEDGSYVYKEFEDMVATRCTCR